MTIARAIRTYLEPSLAKEVANVASAKGRSESAIVAEAVRAHFSADGGEAALTLEESVRRQIDRLEARFEKLMRNQAMLCESMLLYIRVWLEHNPPIEDATEAEAAASAAQRFERFLDLLAPLLAPDLALRDPGLETPGEAEFDAARTSGEAP
jgi:hypothetical protein